MFTRGVLAQTEPSECGAQCIGAQRAAGPMASQCSVAPCGEPPVSHVLQLHMELLMYLCRFLVKQKLMLCSTLHNSSTLSLLRTLSPAYFSSGFPEAYLSLSPSLPSSSFLFQELWSTVVEELTALLDSDASRHLPSRTQLSGLGASCQVEKELIFLVILQDASLTLQSFESEKGQQAA